MIPRYMTPEQLEAAILDGRLSVSGGSDKDLRMTEYNSLMMQQSLMNAFKSYFGAQSGILKFLDTKMTAAVNNPQGFTPSMMAALNTQATEGVANEFNQANVATKEMEAQQGGNGLPSGVQAQLTGQNANAAAQTEAAAQNQIQLANAQQQQQNYWNAVGMLSGTAAQYNPTGMAGQATGAAGATVNAGNAYLASRQSGFFNQLEGGLAKGLGAGLGAGISTGLTGGFSGLAGGGSFLTGVAQAGPQ